MSSDPFGDALRAQDVQRKVESEKWARARESEQATIRDYEHWLNELTPRFYREAKRRGTRFSVDRWGRWIQIGRRKCWLIGVTSEAYDGDGYPKVRMDFAVLSDGSWRASDAGGKFPSSLSMLSPFSVQQGLTYDDFVRAFVKALR